MISLKNVSKVYTINKNQSNTALNGVDLEIQEGEFVALLGPSGCGKSTTLMILAGLLKPTTGEIYFNNQLVNDVEPKDRNIGMVFQSYALYPHLSVRDNMAFPLKQQKMPKAERYKKVEEVAKSVQLSNLLDRKPTQLSGGQQQRVAMGRALCKEPNILLLDEPMSNLDTRLKVDVRDEIRTMQQRLNLTTVIVTHDQEEAMAIADKIAILDEGSIQQFGTPEELYNSPVNLFVANFLGNPPMNILKGVLKKDKSLYLQTATGRVNIFDEKPIYDTYIGKEVAVGVRPTEINPCSNDDQERQDMYVSLVEHLGNKILVKLLLNKENTGEYIRMICDSAFPIKIGDTIPVKLKGKSVHVFDLANQGKNISIL